MKIINSILELPEKYYMHQIAGKTPEERQETARKLIQPGWRGWYIEVKPKGAYLMLEKE